MGAVLEGLGPVGGGGSQGGELLLVVRPLLGGSVLCRWQPPVRQGGLVGWRTLLTWEGPLRGVRNPLMLLLLLLLLLLLMWGHRVLRLPREQ